MRVFAEQLERRTFFAATPIPTAVAAAYAVLIRDNSTLRADMQAFTTALGADVRTLAKEVKTLGRNAGNNTLVAEITRDAATLTLNDSTVTLRFINAANPIFRNTELVEAAFTAKPNLANGHRLAAAVNECSALQQAFTDPRFQSLIGKASDAAVNLGSAVSELTTANPTVFLPAVQDVTNEISNLDNIQADDGDAVLAAIPALLQVS